MKAVELHGLDGPIEQWRHSRSVVHDEVCSRGWNQTVGAFTQFYGSLELDASILMMPLVGFLPADDPRVVATIEAIQRDLMVRGFVPRYQNSSGVDGLSGREGVFLPCTFWLVDCLLLLGRIEEAETIFARLAALVNDVGLISEEFEIATGRMLGNFPQAFAHVGIINSRDE